MKANTRDSDDGFEVLMRRQGWHLTGTAPIHGGEKVVQWQAKYAKGTPSDQDSFYEAFSNDTVRKLIRAILLGPQDMKDLAKICPNQAKLNETLVYLQAGGIV